MAARSLRKKFSDATIGTLRVVAIGVLLAAVLLPVVWLLTTSLSERIAMFKMPPRLFSKPTGENFAYIMTQMPVLTWTRNSLIISFGTMILSLLIGVPAGYAFSRVQFRGKKLLLMAILITRAVPTIVIVMPFRVMMQGLGILGTQLAVILIDTVYNAAFTFWLLSGTFESIPLDIEEAAWIDGCTPVQTFRRIAIPLSKPGLVTSALFAFIFSWNDFLFAMTLTSPKSATLPLGMLSTYGILQQGWTYMAAMGIVAIVPVVALSLVLQKYYVSGLTFGGVK
jgi:ABC-type glycerol-3-phosphate transport system permease component